MYRGNFIESLVIYAISTILTACQIVFKYILPPLFSLTCGLTYWVFLQVQVYIPLTPVLVILLATGIWSVVGLFCLPGHVTPGQSWEQIALFRLLVGGVVGLCIGGQIARDWVTVLSNDQDSDLLRRLGYREDMFTQQKAKGKTVTIEELLAGGVVMGEDLGHRNRGREGRQ